MSRSGRTRHGARAGDAHGAQGTIMADDRLQADDAENKCRARARPSHDASDSGKYVETETVQRPKCRTKERAASSSIRRSSERARVPIHGHGAKMQTRKVPVTEVRQGSRRAKCTTPRMGRRRRRAEFPWTEVRRSEEARSDYTEMVPQTQTRQVSGHRGSQEGAAKPGSALYRDGGSRRRRGESPSPKRQEQADPRNSLHRTGATARTQKPQGVTGDASGGRGRAAKCRSPSWWPKQVKRQVTQVVHKPVGRRSAR